MMAVHRFPIRFTGVHRALSALGLTPRGSWVEVDEEALRVRMGWAFRLDVPRSHVQSARPDTGPVRAWGVHGWRGRWLVNGSSSGIVRIDLAPPGRARVLPWPFAAAVRELRVSVEDPDGLVAALER
jgi:hypothetical protein